MVGTNLLVYKYFDMILIEGRRIGISLDNSSSVIARAYGALRNINNDVIFLAVNFYKR